MNLLQSVIDFLLQRNIESYFVGGWVRDQMLHRAEKRDIDLAVRGRAISLARAFADAHHLKFYLMDEEHGVARVLASDAYVDFADLRGQVQEDLSTRDFTINAMARRISSGTPPYGELVDPFDGVGDLARREVRAVSDHVFGHDPVRLFRSLRIAGELEFTIEPGTEALMRRDSSLVPQASVERVRDEVFKILALDNAYNLLRRADSIGLIAPLFPEVQALKGVAQSEPHIYDVFEHSMHSVDEMIKIQAGGYGEVAGGEFAEELRSHSDRELSAGRSRAVVLRLLALLHDVGKAVTGSVDEQGAIHFFGHEERGAGMAEEIARRMRLSNDEISFAARVLRHHLRPPLLAREPRVTNRAIYRFFRDTGDTGVDICILALADKRALTAPAVDPNEAKLQTVLERFLDAYYRKRGVLISPPRLVDGRVLVRELGMTPGPQVGELLEAIREAQAEGKVTSRDEALELARNLDQTRRSQR